MLSKKSALKALVNVCFAYMLRNVVVVFVVVDVRPRFSKLPATTSEIYQFFNMEKFPFV